ncbi:uncharacterized protein LOC105916717 [Fundulus heteroclitus]|uniref:uncharacterized protein LOC105916717 n=1 Tax=Fundulus heteroclitus TaxID=8078 RepID=UPI00165AE3CA|nr:uncharacterized protein LOC105916717 [Fundulus heteroclitus]
MELIISFPFHLFLMFILQIQESTSVNHVFVQTGNDLILNLTEAEIPPNSTFWVWQFNGNSLVTFSPPSPPSVEETHTGRTEVLEKKYNVKLKNLQKSDSGIYTARSVLPEDKKLSEYNVTVQDPVSPVDLTVDLTSSTSSSIFTVTCRAGNSSISSTLRCENQTCGESRGVTTSGSSLHIYQLDKSIICNHRNQVSWSESTKKIQDSCTTQAFNTAPLFVILAAVVVVVIACVVFKMSKRKRSPNTVYEVPQINPQPNSYENPAEIAPAHSPTSTYALVQFPNRPEQHIDASSCSTPLPETIYAQVNRAEKTNSRRAKVAR